MLAKLLGILDLICVLAIFLVNLLPNQLIMNLGMLLTMKGIIFASMRNLVSILDVVAGIYMGLLIYGVRNKVITVFLLIYLAQKGLLSLLAR